MLLDTERTTYEQVRGRVSRGELLQLLISDEQFAWLRNISMLVVEIDETLHADEPVTLDDAQSLLDSTRTLLTPAEDGNTFEKKYYNAIQREPDVALANAEITQILAQK
ncbi:hypothetical protein WA1_02860 [Scytonema hofmannii PCC 7110]|uniref:Uncharacterized protein n=1 Tax=Scytonema hofmannii PCC 7110 TaxID=128403 RepID=A0A139XHS3_9CYAN|nr:hypothetical protein [Scytonema hofmannii]KYC44240.1 hypothetical protein WA1_02860 [Scytonema hofmannii PCC 7110]